MVTHLAKIVYFVLTTILSDNLVVTWCDDVIDILKSHRLRPQDFLSLRLALCFIDENLIKRIDHFF